MTIKDNCLLFFERIQNWFYRKFKNPYNVNIQGWCPRQAEGVLPTGEFYYFRARGSSCAFYVYKNEGDMSKSKYLFLNIYKDYKPWPQCGALSEMECIRLSTQSIKKYYDQKTSK
jgi:hypothetical protein